MYCKCNIVPMLQTLAFSYMAATISSFHNVEAVLIAMGITCGVCVGVTLFSVQTKVCGTVACASLGALNVSHFLLFC